MNGGTFSQNPRKRGNSHHTVHVLSFLFVQTSVLKNLFLGTSCFVVRGSHCVLDTSVSHASTYSHLRDFDLGCTRHSLSSFASGQYC